MKTTLSLCTFLFLGLAFARAQTGIHNSDGSGSPLLDNDKVEVIKYVGNPQGDVCGIGQHHHQAHLTVALTDARILLVENGKEQLAEIPAGAALWFGPGTHSVINQGQKNTEFLLIYLKE